VSCGSKVSEVNLEVSSSFAITNAGFSGGLVVSGKNTLSGQRFVKTVFGGTSLNVTLPDGTWDMSVVGWDGATPTAGQAPFSGTAYCGKKVVSLASSDIRANIEVTSANCLNADYSGGAYVVGAAIHPLKIVTCGSFYKHTVNPATKITSANSPTINSDFCSKSAFSHPVDMQSRSKSIKLIPINKNFDGPYQAQSANNPYCVPETTGNSGVFNLAQSIPVSNLPVQISFFDDSNCQKLSGSVLFPEGLKLGPPTKFDSIFENKTADSSGPSVANRLIISDNEFHRGWSPLYHLMPDVKCRSGFCGELPVGAIFDYFAEINYPSNNPWQLNLPAAADTCPAIIASKSGPYNLTCTWDPANKKVNLSATPKFTCTGMENSICRSPENVFNFTSDGVNKKIYFQGRKDYSGVKSIRFSHFYENVFTEGDSTTCEQLDTATPASTGSSILIPDSKCVMLDGPVVQAIASYNPSTKTFRVDDSGAKYGTVSFVDGPSTKNLIMLAPDEYEQKDVLKAITSSIGAANLKESFTEHQGNNENDSNHHPNEDKYGTMRKVRNIFSTNGPSMLFDHNTSCLALSGTKSITIVEKDGESNFYEVTVSTNSITSPDTLLTRPNSICVANNPDTSSCTLNSGKFEKRMAIKKNGVLEEVVLFDCSQKSGRLESVEYDLDQGKYRRNKDILYWNTDELANSRFENYSISMEATSSDFFSLTRESYRFEKIHKTGLDSIDGRVIEYSSGVDELAQVYQNIHNLRFNLVDSSGFKLTYSDLNFHEPAGVNFFTDANYTSFAANSLADQHFCSNISFPFVFLGSCFSYNYATGQPALLGPAIMNYQVVKPVTLKSTISGGYLPISW